jgi:hypothetical protein
MAAETITFTATYRINATLLLSAAELLYLYLTDIPIRGLGGEKMSDGAIEEKVASAMEQLESALSIRIPKQKVADRRDYIREEFTSWGFVSTNFLVMRVLGLSGRIAETRFIDYPISWASIKPYSTEARNVYVVPAGDSSTVSLTGFMFIGSVPMLSGRNHSFLPNYWRIEYVTGWDKVPMDIQKSIGKLAAIDVLAILGDVAFGAGIASKSLGMDGLSQSINTTQSAENSLYSARIKQYANEVKDEMKHLKNRYAGIPIVSA